MASTKKSVLGKSPTRSSLHLLANIIIEAELMAPAVNCITFLSVTYTTNGQLKQKKFECRVEDIPLRDRTVLKVNMRLSQAGLQALF